MSNRKIFSSISLLAIALGAFFVILGINGINSTSGTMAEISRGLNKLFGQHDNTVMTIVISVLEILSGAIMILAPWGILQKGIMKVAVLLVFAFWLVKCILDLFVNGEPFKPETLSWIQAAALDLVILMAVWQVRHADD